MNEKGTRAIHSVAVEPSQTAYLPFKSEVAALPETIIKLAREHLSISRTTVEPGHHHINGKGTPSPLGGGGGIPSVFEPCRRLSTCSAAPATLVQPSRSPPPGQELKNRRPKAVWFCRLTENSTFEIQRFQDLGKLKTNT
jgi:hypothetical protein